MRVQGLGQLCARAAKLWPEAVFVKAAGEERTFAQVYDEARRVAGVLAAHGIGRGDIVAMLVGNTGEFTGVFYGILLAGGVPAPLCVLAPAPEIAGYLEDAGVAGVVAASTFGEAVLGGCRQAGVRGPVFFTGGVPESGRAAGALDWDALTAAVDSGTVVEASGGGDEAGVILYTAGTTGRSKGVILTHSNLLHTMEWLMDILWRTGPEDVFLMAAPGFHIFGQTLVNLAALCGGRLIMMERFTPEGFIRAMHEEGVTFLAGVPLMGQVLARAVRGGAGPFPALRRFMMGGAPTPAGLSALLREALGIDVVIGYGMTEGVPMCHTRFDDPLLPEGSVGKPPPGGQVRIVGEDGRDCARGQVGEIAVRGPQISPGYHNRPEETARAYREGWLHTGDAGRMDEAGYLYVVDRIKDMIKTGGYAVSPAEVEDALRSHPAVMDAAVVGAPGGILGESIKAFVMLKPGETVSVTDLVAHCRERLASYKRPRQVVFVENLPRTPTGKVMRHALRAHS